MNNNDIGKVLAHPILRVAKLVQPTIRASNGSNAPHESIVLVLCEAIEPYVKAKRYRYIAHTGDIYTRDADMFTFLDNEVQQ